MHTADLFWPGDERAGTLMSDAAFLAALVAVENAWLAVLVDAGVAPAAAGADLTALVGDEDVVAVAAGAESAGNPVLGLVRLLRERTDAPTGRWLHRGLTSQDVLDSALMICARDAVRAVSDATTGQVRLLAALVERHRDAPMVARTLTQPAVPATIGLKLAVWMAAILDAAEPLSVLVTALPVQAGGAAGTLAAAAELAASPGAALAMADSLAQRLGLTAAAPWHTRRAVITRLGDALVSCCDAWGHIAADVTVLGRPEIGELGEGLPGRSSSMPHKRNPVLAILIRRAALTAPALGATLHSASASSVDERSDGAWHAEWATLRTLARRTVVAGAQTLDLLTGLRIDADRAVANLRGPAGVLAEQHAMAQLAGRDPRPAYTGAVDHLVDAALARAAGYLEAAG